MFLLQRFHPFLSAGYQLGDLRLDLPAHIGLVFLHRILIYQQKYLGGKNKIKSSVKKRGIMGCLFTRFHTYSLIVQNPRHTRKLISAIPQDMLRLVCLGYI